MFQNLWRNSPIGAMRGAGERRRVVSRLATAKRPLLRAAAVSALTLPGALMSPNVACGQVGVTLPEVTVTAPKETTPKPARRPAPAAARPVATRPAASRPPPSPPAPAPAVAALSPFQVVAPTPITGLGIDRSKVPAMVQTAALGLSGDARKAVIASARPAPTVEVSDGMDCRRATGLCSRAGPKAPLRGDSHRSPQ
jgi:hypothetical protein